MMTADAKLVVTRKRLRPEEAVLRRANGWQEVGPHEHHYERDRQADDDRLQGEDQCRSQVSHVRALSLLPAGFESLANFDNARV